MITWAVFAFCCVFFFCLYPLHLINQCKAKMVNMQFILCLWKWYNCCPGKEKAFQDIQNLFSSWCCNKRKDYNGNLWIIPDYNVGSWCFCMLLLCKASPRIQFFILCVQRKKHLFYWNLRSFCLWLWCFFILDLKNFSGARCNVVVCDGSWFAVVVWFDSVGVFYLPWLLRRAIFEILKCFYKENLI